MNFSNYQEAIFDWIENGHGDAVVEAVAGSGKTTTLEEASRRIVAGPVLFAAFNVSIVKELKTRLGQSAECKTINGIGHGCLMRQFGGKVKLDEFKYRDLVKQMTPDLEGKDNISDIRSNLGGLVSFIQTCCTRYPSTEELDELVAHYNIELNHGQQVVWYYEKALAILQAGDQLAQDTHAISFSDQIWLPNIWGLTPKQYPFVFVDEAQDLSKGKLELIMRCRERNGGRMLFVGDRRQSIYGFSGADPAAWDNIIARTNATILPLSICYRCPSSHIELAKGIVPQIEGKDNNDEGTIQEIKLDDLDQHVQTNDLIICRTTAPLIRTCLKLIAGRVPARVLGRDIGRMMVSLAKAAQKISYEISDFPETLREATDRKIEDVKHRKNFETLRDALEDRYEGVLACYEGLRPTSFQQFFTGIEEMFADKESVITLATVHRVKGLQRKRVIILHPEQLGVWGKQEWQKEQERNLKYVALTRSQDTLIFVK